MTEIRTRYVPGDWNAVCYECGRKRKASELRKHWQGYYVCPEHWEARHPQDFTRAVIETQTPPWTQPITYDNISTAVFVSEASDFSLTSFNLIYLAGENYELFVENN